MANLGWRVNNIKLLISLYLQNLRFLKFGFVEFGGFSPAVRHLDGPITSTLRRGVFLNTRKLKREVLPKQRYVIYQTTWLHIPENSDRNIGCCVHNSKFYKMCVFKCRWSWIRRNGTWISCAYERRGNVLWPWSYSEIELQRLRNTHKCSTAVIYSVCPGLIDGPRSGCLVWSLQL